MHPPLFKPHPQCEEAIKQLLACHEEQKLGKWFGTCNSFKTVMDDCLRSEKQAKQSSNLQQAREFDRKFEEYVQRVEVAKQRQQKNSK